MWMDCTGIVSLTSAVVCESCTANDVALLDLNQPMQQWAMAGKKRLFNPKVVDHHFNATGQKLAARLFVKHLSRTLWVNEN